LVGGLIEVDAVGVNNEALTAIVVQEGGYADCRAVYGGVAADAKILNADIVLI
jgi:hypothetical protein